MKVIKDPEYSNKLQPIRGIAITMSAEPDTVEGEHLGDVNQSKKPVNRVDTAYVRERIRSIHNTEMKLVSFLDNFSQLLNSMHDIKVDDNSTEDEDHHIQASDSDEDMEIDGRKERKSSSLTVEEQETKMKQLIDNCYSDLSYASVHLRRELKLLEMKLPLPPNLSKKSVGANEKKLQQLLEGLPKDN